MRSKNTPAANYHYAQARKAIKRLSTSKRPDATVSAICRQLKAAALSDGEPE